MLDCCYVTLGAESNVLENNSTYMNSLVLQNQTQKCVQLHLFNVTF